MSNMNAGKTGYNRGRSRRGAPSNGRRQPNNRRNSGISASNALSARNKYIDKAKEALGSGDKISAENFFQHADHYSRILNEHEEHTPTPNKNYEQKESASQAESENSENTPQEESGNDIINDHNNEIPQAASEA